MPAVACKVSPAPAPPKAKGWSGCTGTATGDVPAKVNDLDALTPGRIRLRIGGAGQEHAELAHRHVLAPVGPGRLRECGPRQRAPLSRTKRGVSWNNGSKVKQAAVVDKGAPAPRQG